MFIDHGRLRTGYSFRSAMSPATRLDPDFKRVSTYEHGTPRGVLILRTLVNYKHVTPPE
jgi:hypothetical protein